MSATPITDMIVRLLAEGVATHVIVDMVRAFETVTTRHDGVVTPSRSKEAERAARYRENRKQKQGGAKANDVASVPEKKRDGRHDASRREPNLLSSLSLNSEGSTEEGRKPESKKTRSENARARGQRMVAGALLSDECRQAAMDLGANPSSIESMWAEFVDYWVAVPGQRGVKLDWLATWRNDVRRKLERGTPNGSAKRQSLSDTAFDLAEQARSSERARGLI